MSTVNIKNYALNLVPLSGTAGLVTITTAAKSYADMTGPGGTGSVSISSSCTHVMVNLENGDMRERGDGTAPTSTVGMVRADGYSDIMHVTDFKARKWIRDSGAGADGKLWVQQLTQD